MEPDYDIATIEMKNAFCELFSRLEMFEVRISDLGDMSIGIFQI